MVLGLGFRVQGFGWVGWVGGGVLWPALWAKSFFRKHFPKTSVKHLVFGCLAIIAK